MNPEARARELLAGFHLGTLRDEETRELQDLATSDPAVARAVAFDLLLDRLLGRALAGSDAGEFSRRVQSRLQGQPQDGPSSRKIWGGLSMVAALFLLCLTLWTTLHPPADRDRIHALVLRLGSDQSTERSEARRALLEFGEKARPALEEAALSGNAALAAAAGSVLAALEKSRDDKDWEDRVKALPTTSGTRRISHGVEIVLKTSAQGKDLLLSDETFIPWGGKKTLVATVKTVCAADPSFAAREFTFEATDPSTGKKISYAGKFKDGKVTITGDKPQELEVSPKTMTTLSVYRLLWTLPQKAGFQLEFDLFNERLQYQPGQKVTCLGEEEIVLGGKALKAWKWEFDRRVPEMVDLYAKEFYWVAQGKVVKASSETRAGTTYFEAEDENR